MNRAEFLALMVSPLILPFVEEKRIPLKGQVGKMDGFQCVVTYPNGTKTHISDTAVYYGGGRGGGKTTAMKAAIEAGIREGSYNYEWLRRGKYDKPIHTPTIPQIW